MKTTIHASRSASIAAVLLTALTAESVAAAFGFPAGAQAFNHPLLPAASQSATDDLMTAEGVAAAMLSPRRSVMFAGPREDDVLEPSELSAEDLSDRIEEHERLVSVIRAGMRNSSGSQLRRDEDRLDSVEQSLAVLLAEHASRQPTGRRTTPGLGGDRDLYQTRAQADASARQPRASVPAQPRSAEHGMAGFNGVGDYLSTVMTASARGGTIDPRLIVNAPTTFGQEAVGADGGFAVPPDFRSTIVSRVMGEDSLLSLTDQWTTQSNSITVPVDETTPWQTSGGIQAYWESEGGQKTQSKPKLGQTTIKANKIISLVPLTDELLEDAVSMGNYVNRKAPEKIDYKVNEAIISGSGVGQPLGILQSGSLITVAAEGGQAADSLVYANIANLWNRMPAKSRRTAVWLMNADVESQLQFLAFPGTGTAVPVYLPPGGLSGSPYSTLYGRPIIVSEALPALGDVGDIVLADMKQYMSLVKTGGIRQDVSIHLWFDYDITAFRFVLRVGGQPWWNSPITRLNGLSRSPFITLAAR